MPAAVPTTRRVRALLAARGMTVQDMATAIGRDVLTLRNVITGAAQLKPTQQAISDFLEAEIFPGVKPRLKFIALKLPRGTQITLPTESTAKAFKLVLLAAAKRDGKRITLLESIIARIPKHRKEPSASPIGA